MQGAVVALANIDTGAIFDFAVPELGFLRCNVVVVTDNKYRVEALNGVCPLLVAFDDGSPEQSVRHFQ